MEVYKSDPSTGEIYETKQCDTVEEKADALAKGWWETPRWKTNPRPHGLSQDNIYERTVPAPNAEYPRHLHKAGGKHVVVHTEAEKAKRLKEGWVLKPVLDGVSADA